MAQHRPCEGGSPGESLLSFSLLLRYDHDRDCANIALLFLLITIFIIIATDFGEDKQP